MMRKRNNIVFNLVESEREYVHQLEILVANYVRPFRMGKKHRSPLEIISEGISTELSHSF